MSDKKVILFDETPNLKKVKEKKEPKKRVVPQQWKIETKDYESVETQKDFLKKIKENNFVGTDYETKLVVQQMERKIYGYKQQDVLKNHFNSEKFITLNNLVDSLIEKDCKCFYCKTDMYVLYDMVRENNQWTVDRVDNDLGHNNDNYVLACLGCNLKRRCRTKEKFLFTKELKIIKREK